MTRPCRLAVLSAPILASVLLVAGCDLAPKENLPIIHVAVAYKDAAAWKPANPSDEIPRGAWWTLYHDPVLTRLEERLDSNNPDLENEVAIYDRARAYAQEAESGLYPTLTFGSAYSYHNLSTNARPLRPPGQPATYGRNSFDAFATYEIDVWDKLHNEARAGQALAEAAAGDLATAKLSLEAELASDYLVWRGLVDEVALLHRTVASYQAAYNLVSDRFHGQIAPEVDVSRAETQLEDARATLAGLINRQVLMEHAIGTLTGTPATDFTMPADSTPLSMPYVPPGMPSTLLERRPDIAAAERRVAAAAHIVGVARAAFYPDISLGLVGGFASNGPDLFTLPNSAWVLGSGLLLPILDGGYRQAELNDSEAALRSADAVYRATVLSAFQDVEDALSEIHWLGEEQKSASAAVKSAQLTVSQATALYRDGATNFLEVAVAQTQELDAERRAVQLHAVQTETTVNLIRALGGGWTRADIPPPPQPGLLHAGP
ncbi:efflux transporter outer membrane subunit [Acidisphaera rubrifaciens]|uniref:Secretion system type I outer membrane efflux pump lipoprotein NodT n=1 Tax=Acidisphaera rubrifaciens HS-AP3 TaxID=1231350 RepID=A0A0D6P6J2_9PROT|nr:efflux transporter outer membrane subunit [Acidisphaera rubrifaciens]GAN77385.1 secretion system type I outer membrane efflux pump lipoprotein NodT [Acidisphaera rubrifaciens HS-AP3]